MGPAFEKVFDLSFSLETNVNCTKDLEIIQNHLKGFQSYCNMNGKNIWINHCRNLLSLVTIEGNNVKNVITSIATNKYKRKAFWPAVIRFGAKHATGIVLSAGVIYQQTEITRLTIEADSARYKLHNTAMLILNKTDLQYDQLDNKLNQSINVQRDLVAEGLINVYTEKLSLIFKTILNTYEQIINITPYIELEQYFMTLKDKVKDVILPIHLKDQMFKVYAPKVSVINKMLTITFRIPTIKATEFQKFAIISVPASDGKLIELPNQQLVDIIVFDPRQNITFDPNNATKIASRIYDQVQWKKSNMCTITLLTKAKPDATCNHSIVKPQYNNYLLETDYAVVFPSENLSFICGNVTRAINKTIIATLVNFEKCIIVNGKNKLASINPEPIIINIQEPAEIEQMDIPQIKMTNITINSEEIESYRKQIEEITKYEEYHPFIREHLSIIIILITLSLLLSSLPFLVRCYLKKKILQQATPETSRRNRIDQWSKEWMKAETIELNKISP